MASLALSPSVPCAHCADQLAGLAVVGGEGRVGGVHRVERRVEHDHHQAGVARLLDRRHDRLRVARHDGEALGAGRDQVLDRGDLAVIVAVDTCRRRCCSVDAEFLGLRLGAFAHLDEERVGLGLGDQADDDLVGDRPGRRRTPSATAPAMQVLSRLDLISTSFPPFDEPGADMAPGDYGRPSSSKSPALPWPAVCRGANAERHTKRQALVNT